MGATPDDGLMVRNALNAVSEEWETFVQGILGRVTLSNWEDMWATLRQEEIRRMSKMDNNTEGVKIKKDEEEDALSHLRDSSNNEGRRRKTFQRSGASDVVNWDISPQLVL